MKKKLVTAFIIAMSISSVAFANVNADDINSVKQEIKSIEENKNAD